MASSSSSSEEENDVLKYENFLTNQLYSDSLKIVDEIIESHKQLKTVLNRYKDFYEIRIHCINLLKQFQKEKSKDMMDSDRFSEIRSISMEVREDLKDIDDPKMTVMSRIIPSFLHAFTSLFNRKLGKNDIRVKFLEIREALHKDNSLSCNFYTYAVTCRTQLIKTRHSIQEFVNAIQSLDLKMEDFKDNYEFFQILTNLSEWNTRNEEQSFSNFKLNFKALSENFKKGKLHTVDPKISRSRKKFAIALDCASDRIEILDFLPWKFDNQNFDPEKRKFDYLKEVDYFFNCESFDMDEFLGYIENALLRLGDELHILHQTMASLVEMKKHDDFLRKYLGDDIMKRLSKS